MALFSQYRIFDVQDGQKRQLRKTIQSLEANYLLNSSEEDLANSLVAELALDIPEINESAIYVEHEERQIDVAETRCGSLLIGMSRSTLAEPR